jgi:hypothetical protein
VAPSGYLPPAVLELTPINGTGPGAVFRLVLSDPDGNADLEYARLLINSTFTGTGGCYLEYSRAGGTVSLANDAFTAFAGSLTPGLAGTVSNSQCQLDGPSSSVTLSGNNAILNLAVAFSPSFAGAKLSYVHAVDIHGLTRGWQGRGAWTVTTSVSHAPTVAGSPTTGIGRTRTFTLVVTDVDGYADVSYARILISPVKRTFSACYILYDSPTNRVYLYDDAGTFISSPYLTPGSAGVLSNSQCSLDGAASSVSKSGNTVTLNVAITFTAAYSGGKIYFALAWDSTANSGWQSIGSWTVP